MVGLQHRAVAVEVVVGRRAGFIGGDASEDGDGEDVDIEEQVAYEDGGGCRGDHGIVSGHPAEMCWLVFFAAR